jgi:hypothetical protein
MNPFATGCKSMGGFRDISVRVVSCDRFHSEIGKYLSQFVLRDYCGPVEAIDVRVRSINIELIIRTNVIDVHTKKPIRLATNAMLPVFLVEQARDEYRMLDRWLLDRLTYVVTHELQECLRKGDEFVVNPHPEVAGYAETAVGSTGS